MTDKICDACEYNDTTVHHGAECPNRPITNRQRLLSEGILVGAMTEHEIATAYPDPILDCGHPPSAHDAKVTTGYAIGDGYGRGEPEIVCYDCANARQISHMRDADTMVASLAVRDIMTGPERERAHKEPIGYMGHASVYEVSTWTGGKLATVTYVRKTRAGFSGSRWYFDAVDTNGKRWHGSAPGPGMYCRLRACKIRRGNKVRVWLDNSEICGIVKGLTADGWYKVQIQGTDAVAEYRLGQLKAGW